MVICFRNCFRPFSGPQQSKAGYILIKTTIILPNYGQSSQIAVIYSDGNGWKNSSYTDAVSSTLSLPTGCGRGIPAPVLGRQRSPDQFVLGQLICTNGHPRVFLKSCPAGKDRTGRGVFLTILWSEGLSGPPGGNYHVTLDTATIRAATGSAYTMDDTQAAALSQAITLINIPPQESAAAINAMWLKSARSPHYTWFASVPMEGAGYLPDSQKNSETSSSRGSLSGSSGSKKAILTVLIIFILLVGVAYCSHHTSTQQPPPTQPPLIPPSQATDSSTTADHHVP